MKRFVMAIALASVLSVPVVGGDIPTADFVPPPPPPAPSAISPGDIPTGDFGQRISNEAKLIVLRTIFSLFAR